jgi:putative hydrolase of the HAD superfamily
MELSGIKNIIFDLGGVLLNIDPRRTIDAFARLGMPQFINDRGSSYAHDVFLRMEQGQISSDEFRSGINQLLPQKATDDQLDAAWTAMILDFPAIRIEILRKLATEFGIYLFSNTNEIHIRHFHRKFKQEHGLDFPTLFQKDFYSHEIGIRKPAPESFFKVLSEANLIARETLFIDDSEENIHGAAQTGLQTFWLKPGMTLEEVFKYDF